MRKLIFRGNLSFALGYILILVILIIRVTSGIDLTDEMQYYGQITGLINTGKLFSSDLFLQQLVYLPFYPFFLVHDFLFSNFGLVFFGRLILAIISLGIFIYSYKRFVYYKTNPFVACLSAIAITFAIPYHGVFALSYNTVSQALWIIFFFRYYEWQKHDLWIFNILILLMLFSHQTSAILMGILVYSRLFITMPFATTLRQAGVLFLYSVLAILLMLNFTSLSELNASLIFTSDHAVGSGFFASNTGIVTFAIIAIGLALVLIFGKYFVRLPAGWIIVIALLASNILLLSGKYGSYSPRTVYVLATLVVVLFWVVKSGSHLLYLDDSKLLPNKSKDLMWLILAIYFYALILAITSGNGLGQATGAFLVAVAFLLPISFATMSNESIIDLVLQAASSLLLLGLCISYWTLSPYREVSWLQTNVLIKEVPEFRLIRTSNQRAQFIRQIRSEWANDIKGKRVLIVSDFPAFYFISGALPETCQLYMHSMGGKLARDQLAHCLNQKNPEFILDVFTDKDIAKPQSMIKSLARQYYEKPGFTCSDHTMRFDSHLANNPIANNPTDIRYTLCRHIGSVNSRS